MTALYGKRVLLVEDDITNLDVASMMLEDMGMIVDTASNGAVALNKIKSNDYDVVLMDICMPVMDGIEATKSIKTDPHLKHVPIIACTAHTSHIDHKAYKHVGVDDVVPKPIDFEVLRSYIKKHIGHQS